MRPMLLARADEVLEYSFGLFRYSQASRQHGNQRQGATFASPMKARHKRAFTAPRVAQAWN